MPVSAALNWNAVVAAGFPSSVAMVAGSIACMALVSLMASRATKVPLGSVPRAVMVSAVLSFGVLTAALLVTRSYFSESYVLIAFGWTIAWVSAGLWLRSRLIGPPKWGLAAVGCVEPLHEVERVVWVDLPEVPDQVAGFGAIVADMRRPHSEAWSRFLTDCRLARVPVLDASAVYEAATGRVRSEWVSESELLSACGARRRFSLKLALDYLCTLLVAPLAVILVLGSAVAIKLDDGGPIFFTQRRVGLGGRTFRIFKLRTMTGEGPADAAHIGGTPTRIGRFLRRFRLDELPQLLNVLRGEMSIVGPRPEQRAIVDTYTAEIPAYGVRHIVRPGLTGWSQVHYGYAADAQESSEKLEYDLYYIKHRSFLLDFTILIRSIGVVVTGRGAL
jgi:lipopolysaccharide/colanic/teichoic acid biosynthesis glycosyltransferase